MIVSSTLRRITVTFGLAAAALALATPASAAPLKFAFTGVFNGSFLIDSNPAPTFHDSNQFQVDYTAGTGDFPASANAIFYVNDLPGGFDITTPFADHIGPILWTGTTAAPQFKTGKFSLDGGSTVLNIGPGAPAPELATGLLAAMAAFGALALTRRRQPA